MSAPLQPLGDYIVAVGEEAEAKVTSAASGPADDAMRQTLTAGAGNANPH